MWKRVGGVWNSVLGCAGLTKPRGDVGKLREVWESVLGCGGR